MARSPVGNVVGDLSREEYVHDIIFAITPKANPFDILYRGLVHLAKYGIEPQSILIGPRDLALFIGKLRKDGKIDDAIAEQPIALIPNLMGYPVRLKSSNGIEFEIPMEEWTKFV